MLPDWVPNVHPLVVHFPIALLLVAALVDAIALAVRKTHPWVQTSAVGLYALGALGAAAAFLTGRDASDEVDLPAQALTTLNAHADWALYLVWFAGLYALVRVVALCVTQTLEHRLPFSSNGTNSNLLYTTGNILFGVFGKLISGQFAQV